MPSPRVLILRAPGTNCNSETEFAFAEAGGKPECFHVNRWLESPSLADDFQILCVAGGFSYGDDVGAGKILANQIHRHLADALEKFQTNGKLVIGICNGFQALLKTGFLTKPDEEGPTATLAWNNSGKFEDRWVNLKVDNDNCVFLKGIEQMYLPMAHAEGKFVPRNSDILGAMDQAGQLVLKYATTSGDASGEVPYPENPNGSAMNVAGICDSTGRIFGLMPHPERFTTKTQHPRWTREDLPEAGDGLKVFQNAVEYFS